MNKFFKILMLMLFASPLAKAGVENATTLCIENTSGEVVSFALAEEPKIMFKGNYVVVQASEIKLLKFKDLTKAYSTAEDPDGIYGANLTQEEISTLLNTVQFRNFTPGANVLVYSVAGHLLHRTTIGEDGTLQYSLDNLLPGTYVIKAGKTSFKVYKR